MWGTNVSGLGSWEGVERLQGRAGWMVGWLSAPPVIAHSAGCDGPLPPPTPPRTCTPCTCTPCTCHPCTCTPCNSCQRCIPFGLRLIPLHLLTCPLNPSPPASPACSDPASNVQLQASPTPLPPSPTCISCLFRSCQLEASPTPLPPSPPASPTCSDPASSVQLQARHHHRVCRL